MMMKMLRGGAKPPSFIDSLPQGSANDGASRDRLVPIPPLPDSLSQFVAYNKAPKMSFLQQAIVLNLLDRQQTVKLEKARPVKGKTVAHWAVENGLLEQEAADQINDVRKLTVTCDTRHRGSAAFNSWLAALQECDIPFHVETATQAEFSERLKQQTNSSRDEDTEGLEVLNSAAALFENLAAMKASDLHIIRRTGHTTVQARIDGRIRDLPQLSMTAAEGDTLIRSICTGLTTSKNTTFNPTEFQHAQISGDEFPGSGMSGIRLVRGPCYPVAENGKFLVARMQYGRERARDAKGQKLATKRPVAPDGTCRLPEWGYTEKQMTLLGQLLRKSYGIVLVTGPTGSGKTTTLAEAMKEQYRLFPDTRHITAEEPVENPMPWAIQLEASGDTWQQILRETLRSDPDVLLFGELRSANEVMAAMQAASTGHFVWATLHTNDPYQTFTRMEDMDESQLAIRKTADADRIKGIIAQRILSKLCTHCCRTWAQRKEGEIPQEMESALKTWGSAADLDKIRLAGDGCQHCNDGWSGRTAVAEVVITDSEFMAKVKSDGVDAARAWHRAREGSDKSLLAHAMRLVFDGVVSPLDAEREVETITVKETP